MVIGHVSYWTLVEGDDSWATQTVTDTRPLRGKSECSDLPEDCRQGRRCSPAEEPEGRLSRGLALPADETATKPLPLDVSFAFTPGIALHMHTS